MPSDKFAVQSSSPRELEARKKEDNGSKISQGKDLMGVGRVGARRFLTRPGTLVTTLTECMELLMM